MHPHCPAMPWMPGIADFTEIPNMGVVLLSCITAIERVRGWKDAYRNRLREERYHQPVSVRSGGGGTVAACTKVRWPLDPVKSPCTTSRRHPLRSGQEMKSKRKQNNRILFWNVSETWSAYVTNNRVRGRPCLPKTWRTVGALDDSRPPTCGPILDRSASNSDVPYILRARS